VRYRSREIAGDTHDMATKSLLMRQRLAHKRLAWPLKQVVSKLLLYEEFAFRAAFQVVMLTEFCQAVSCIEANSKVITIQMPIAAQTA